MRKIKFRGKIQSCSGQFDRHFRHKQQLGGLIEYLLLEKLFRRNIENGAEFPEKCGLRQMHERCKFCRSRRSICLFADKIQHIAEPLHFSEFKSIIFRPVAMTITSEKLRTF